MPQNGRYWARVVDNGRVPLLVEAAIAPGSLRVPGQPTLDIDEHLRVRPWRPDDAAAVRAAFDCPEIQRWFVRRMDSEAEAREWIAGWADVWATETDSSWAVVDGGDEVVGQVGLRSIRLFEASAQLSYWVIPAARGTGVATRAAGALARWAFDRLGMNRLYLVHTTGNLPSCRVAGRLGFPVEGTLRDYIHHQDGFHDVHVHARLRRDAGGPAG